MTIAQESPDSEDELRWRTWQEKGQRADRLADKRMKVLFSIVGLILLALILYYTLRPKVFLAPEQRAELSRVGPLR